MLFKVLNIEGLFQMEYQKEKSNRLLKCSRHNVRTKNIHPGSLLLTFSKLILYTLTRKQMVPHTDLHQSNCVCHNS